MHRLENLQGTTDVLHSRMNDVSWNWISHHFGMFSCVWYRMIYGIYMNLWWDGLGIEPKSVFHTKVKEKLEQPCLQPCVLAWRWQIAHQQRTKCFLASEFCPWYMHMEKKYASKLLNVCLSLLSWCCSNPLLCSIFAVASEESEVRWLHWFLLLRWDQGSRATDIHRSLPTTVGKWKSCVLLCCFCPQICVKEYHLNHLDDFWTMGNVCFWFSMIHKVSRMLNETPQDMKKLVSHASHFSRSATGSRYLFLMHSLLQRNGDRAVHDLTLYVLGFRAYFGPHKVYEISAYMIIYAL